MNYICGFFAVNQIHCWVFNTSKQAKNCAVCHIDRVIIKVRGSDVEKKEK